MVRVKIHFTPDKELIILTYWTPSYVVYRSYTLIKLARFFWPTLHIRYRILGWTWNHNSNGSPMPPLILPEGEKVRKYTKLENVAIANALQLEAARCRAVPIRFNFVSRAKFEVAQPIRCHLRAFLLLVRHVMLWPWTLTRDLDFWPLTYIVDWLRHGQTLYEIWAKSGNMRRSYCDLNIWPYMPNLAHVSHAPQCCGIVFTKLKLSQAIRSWNVTCFDANTSCHAVTLTFDPLTLKVEAG